MSKIPEFRAWYDNRMWCLAKLDLWGDPDQTTCDLAPYLPKYSEKFNIPLAEVKLMQSTGLKDKNGVEIFEGDVVHYTSSIVNKADWYKKIVRHGSALLMVSFDERSRDSSELLNALSATKGIEVIGNIYENPELLEELR